MPVQHISDQAQTKGSRHALRSMCIDPALVMGQLNLKCTLACRMLLDCFSWRCRPP